MKVRTRALLLCSLAAPIGFGADAAPPVRRMAQAQPATPAAPAAPATPQAQPATPPAPPPPPVATAAPSKPGVAAADNLSVSLGAGTTIRIPHLEIAGSTLTGSDIVAMFALKDAKAIEARLRGLDATMIDMPEIIGDSVDGATTTHWVARATHLADIKAGRAATARIAATTLTIKDDKSTTAFATEAIAFQGLALAQFAHLATGPRTDDREAIAPLFDDMTVASTKINDVAKPTSAATIASLHATGVKARPLPKRAPKPTEPAEDLAVFLDVLQAFAADDLSADGLVITPDGTAGNVVRMGLNHIALKGFADSRLGRFELKGLSIDGDESKPGRVAIGLASVDGLAVGAHAAASMDRIDIDNVVADIPNDDWGKGARMKLSIAHSAYDAPGLVFGKLPAKAVLTIDHMATEVPPQAQGAAVLYTMGYKTIDLSCRIASRYDGAAQTLVLEPFSLTGTGMGTVAVKLDLAHVSEAIVSQNDALQKAAAAAIQVKGLDLTVDNAGLVEKLSGFAAAGNGKTPEQVRANLAAEMDVLLANLGLQGSFKAKLIADALRSFLTNPKNVHIALSSRNGLGLDAVPLIDNPQTLLDALEVKAEANK